MKNYSYYLTVVRRCESLEVEAHVLLQLLHRQFLICFALFYLQTPFPFLLAPMLIAALGQSDHCPKETTVHTITEYLGLPSAEMLSYNYITISGGPLHAPASRFLVISNIRVIQLF